MIKKTSMLLLSLFVSAVFAYPFQPHIESDKNNPFFTPVTVEHVCRPAYLDAPVTRIEEGFEEDTIRLPDGWSTVDADGNGEAWFIYSFNPHSGNNSAGTWYDTEIQNDDWLISPPVFIVDSSYTLFFWIASQEESLIWLESYELLISSTDAMLPSFTDTIDAMMDIPHLWQKREFSLSDYAEDTIYIAWRCVSFDDFVLKVDDVYVGHPQPAVTPQRVQVICAPDCEVLLPFEIVNEKDTSVQFDVELVTPGAWGVGIYDSSGTTSIERTDLVSPDDTIKLAVKFEMPDLADSTVDSAIVRVMFGGDSLGYDDITLVVKAVLPFATSFSCGWDTEDEIFAWHVANLGDGYYGWFLADSYWVEGEYYLIGSPPYSVTVWRDSSNQDLWLISSLMDFRDAENAHISFRQISVHPAATVYHGIWASTTNGSPYWLSDQWFEVESLASAPEGTYGNVNVSLDAVAGEMAFIAFRYKGFWADDWYIDDVVIGPGTIIRNIPPKSENYKLLGNAPNPFNATTTIYTNGMGEGNIEILDIGGRIIRTLPISGSSAVWDGRTDTGDEAPCGLYLYRLAGSRNTRRMVLLK